MAGFVSYYSEDMSRYAGRSPLAPRYVESRNSIVLKCSLCSLGENYSLSDLLIATFSTGDVLQCAIGLLELSGTAGSGSKNHRRYSDSDRARAHGGGCQPPPSSQSPSNAVGPTGGDV